MFKVITEGCEPTRGSKYSACVDLYASEDVTIGAGETKVVGLGVAIDLEYLHDRVDLWCGHAYNLRISSPSNDYEKHTQEIHNRNFEWYMNHHYLQLMLRSSLGKKGLILPNGVGIIDLDYKDEIKMIIHNPIALIDYDKNTNTMYQWCKPNKHGFMSDVEIKKGDKIAQITLLEHKGYLFGIDTDTERNGGFGSTGA